MKKFLLIAIIAFSAFSALAQTHEYAPLKEADVKYKDWKYKNIDGAEVNLRSAITGKKLVLVVYFAAWCPQWRNQAPFTQKLYDKYKANGLHVIGVSEYETLDKVKTNLRTFKITFPVVLESESSADRDKTPHAGYRKETGDARRWGSPWNIFLEPATVKKDGDTLTTKAHVVNGELQEEEVEKFIRQKLGLPADEKAAGANAATAENKTSGMCEDGPVNPLGLKKP